MLEFNYQEKRNKSSASSVIIVCCRGTISWGTISCFTNNIARFCIIVKIKFIWIVNLTEKRKSVWSETSTCLQACSCLCEEFSPASVANQSCLWSEVRYKCFQAMSHRWTWAGEKYYIDQNILHFMALYGCGLRAHIHITASCYAYVHASAELG